MLVCLKENRPFVRNEGAVFVSPKRRLGALSHHPFDIGIEISAKPFVETFHVESENRHDEVRGVFERETYLPESKANLPHEPFLVHWNLVVTTVCSIDYFTETSIITMSLAPSRIVVRIPSETPVVAYNF